MASSEKCITETELRDFLMDHQDEFEARYKALESVTVQILREQNSKLKTFEGRLNDVEKKIESSKLEELDDSLSSLREEFDKLKNKSDVRSSSPVCVERFQGLNRATDERSDTTETDNVRTSTPVASPVKKKTKFVFGKDKKSPVAFTPPKFLEDIKDMALRENLKEHYECRLSTAAKLHPIQLAFLMYFFQKYRRGEFSARSDVISELFTRGLEHGMWSRDWSPGNIKGRFQDYLKEKVRNMAKKRHQDAATSELLEQIAREEKILK